METDIDWTLRRGGKIKDEERSQLGDVYPYVKDRRNNGVKISSPRNE